MLKWHIEKRGGKFLNVDMENDIVRVVRGELAFEISGDLTLCERMIETLSCLTDELKILELD
jgi:hypothetical protein